MGKIFYIMGKSSAGKDSFYRALMKKNPWGLKKLVIYTTRPIRDGEKDGREYHFVSEDRYQQLKAEGKIIEERCYDTVYGPWRYFTADDGTVDPARENYLAIGTLESYRLLKAHYGSRYLCPIYVEVEDGERLKRAIAREETQEIPKYEEMCRRFLADSRDFSEDKIREAGIECRFLNTDFNTCLGNIEKYIISVLY